MEIRRNRIVFKPTDISAIIKAIDETINAALIEIDSEENELKWDREIIIFKSRKAD